MHFLRRNLAMFSLLACTSLVTFSLPAFAEEAQEPAPSAAANQYQPGPDDVLTNLTRSQLEQIIKDYIIKHPEVIVQTLVISEQQQKQNTETMVKQGIQTHQDELYNDKHSPVAGNPKGDVTIVEFFDYNCGFCKKISPTLAELIKEDKNVRVIFKEYPILSPESEVAAKAAIAFYQLKPEKYLDYHLAIMAHQGVPDMALLNELAAKHGVTGNQLKNMMEDKIVEKQLESVRNLGNALYIEGTPSTVIGEELVVGPIALEAMKEKIAAIRDKK